MEEPINKGSRLENLKVIDASSDGQSVARIDNAVVFIEGGVPGDVVDVEVYRKRKSFWSKDSCIQKSLPIVSNLFVLILVFVAAANGSIWVIPSNCIHKQSRLNKLWLHWKIEIPSLLPIVGSRKPSITETDLNSHFPTNAGSPEKKLNRCFCIRRCSGFMYREGLTKFWM